MDRAPQRKRRVSGSQLIATAVLLAGSADAVRERMGCTEEDFQAYRDGVREPHWRKVATLLELCIEAQRRRIAVNKRLIEETRARLGGRPRR
jgi:hypothetical protein